MNCIEATSFLVFDNYITHGQILRKVSQSGIKLTELLQNVSQLLQTVTICTHTDGGFSKGPKH